MNNTPPRSTGSTNILSGMAADADREGLVTVNDHLYISKDMGDSIMITTAVGNVVVNTGLPGNGERHAARFAQINTNPLTYIILTQCHANQFGGVAAMKGPETRVITQGRFQECRQYWQWLNDFYLLRSQKLWRSTLGSHAKDNPKIAEVTPDVTFDDTYRFELAGRVFELLATPGGESRDALVVWLPQDRMAITGNLFGPIFGHFPNLYTIRGDKIRSAKKYNESLSRVLALKPETIITGHEVIHGSENIQQTLTKIRDAVDYIHDETIAGMNAGKTVYQLMADISLPEHLMVGQGHGKVAWCVRAIWEEYAGWFHYDATTSLYAVPHSAIANDLVELAGGVGPLVSRAQSYIDAEKYLEAMHLLDTVLAAVPDDKAALQAKLKAHELLLDERGTENFSEVQWLTSEITALKQKLV